MDDLSNLTPQPLWNIFEELTRIPRPSKGETRAVAWLLEKARAWGCDAQLQPTGPDRDNGNVLIRKAAFPGRENRDAVALQAHIDMVCEKAEGSKHDFGHDPLQLSVRGDDLYATDTTLGADNGVGVAAALAVLASKDIKHGPLEVLITVDEETGLTGAKTLRPGWLRARHLLNLDSEEEGTLTIGCAGGVDTVASRVVGQAAAPDGWKCLAIKVRGLKGGHSGIEIHAGRANAIRLLAQILEPLTRSFGLRLAVCDGGNQRNAIPREATAIVFAKPEDESSLVEEIRRAEVYWRNAFAELDPGLSIGLEPAQASFVLPEAEAQELLRLLIALPHGIDGMSAAVPGLVETSTNLARVHAGPGQAEIQMLTRGSVEAFKNALRQRIEMTCALAGFDPREEGSYPGWKPSPGSPLVKLLQEVHLDTFGKPLTICAIHAGLECGIIGERYPGMHMVSLGPTILGVHTPKEHISISSTANFWKLLVATLERI